MRQLLYIVVALMLFACARVIVQVGSNHEVETTLESKPKTGVGIVVDKKEDKP